MKISYIIGDIHKRVYWVEAFIESLNGEYDEIIFVGDYFDNHSRLLVDSNPTISWLKKSIVQPNRIHILGNHDLPYQFPQTKGLFCSGYNTITQNAVRDAFKKEDWNRFKLYHRTQNFHITHAGWNPSTLHPVFGFDEKYLNETCENALEAASIGVVHNILQPGMSRGGKMLLGGITWADWNMDFQPVEGMNQIVGHTMGREVRFNNGKDSTNVCIDCCNTFVGKIVDGTFYIVKNEFII